LKCFREEKDKSKIKLGKKSSRVAPSSVATDGIDIFDWIETISIDDGMKVDLTINAWDFAGQVVYYTTHQFFLSQVCFLFIYMNGYI
jgi:leucine-rich repeat kinase 2